MPKIAEVMTRGVEVIRPDDSLQRAAQMMDELNVGALPVCDGKQLIGMITDRDITVRATAVGLDPEATCVSEVMTDQARWCTEEQSTDEVMRQMGDVQIRRLPVLNAANELVGIISLGDLATRQAGHVDDALRDISWPSEPDRSEAA
ncbi:MAG TPA: CBS domain-containing protein [Albitalea sp.]|nr:CBS domain-containing protein [Albitalea sp.]